MNTHQDVIDEFFRQTKYGVMQRTVCAVVVDTYYGSVKTHMDIFKKVHRFKEADVIELTEICSYLQGLTSLQALALTRGSIPESMLPFFVGMTAFDAFVCKSQIDYMCDFTYYGDSVRIKWDNVTHTSDLLLNVKDMVSSVGVITLPKPLPPVRVQDDLPPPSPAFQASVSRWCDFDGED